MKTLVFSLDTAQRQPPKEEYNTMREHMLTAQIIVNDAKGVWKGREENSFICLIDTELQEKMIMAIAHAYKQEAVLEVDMPTKLGYLRFMDGAPRKFLGTWKEAPVDVTDNFTVNVNSMKVYQCVDMPVKA